MAHESGSRLRPRWLRQVWTCGALTVGVLLSLTSSCRRAPPPKLGWLAASDSDDEPQPEEKVYQPLPPMDIGVLRDEDETSCGEQQVHHIRAVSTALGRLWVLDGDGHLSSFDAALDRRQSHLTDRAVDVIRRADDGSLWAAVNEANRWRIVRRDASGWRHIADLPAGLWNDDALAEHGGRPVLATREAKTFWFDAAGLLHLWDGPRPSYKGRTAAAVTSDGSIYIARDAGEFGGRLEMIRAGGPGHRTQAEVVHGPTTDVVVDPSDRRCVIASQGIEHGSASGRILRSCAGEASTILELADLRCDAESQARRLCGEGQTVPFYKLITNGSDAYALAPPGTYAISGTAARILSPPTFAERCGLTIATSAGVTLIRLPWLAKGLRHDVIGFNRFAAPAL